MAILDYLDDWKLDFDFEIDEPIMHDQDENFGVSFDDYLDVFEHIDPYDMTMH